MTLATIFAPGKNLATRELTDDRAAELVQRFESLGLGEEADAIIDAAGLAE